MSESFFLKRKNERLFSYIFVHQKNHSNIVLVQLDTAKPLPTLNKKLVKRITYKVLLKFLENFENVSWVSFIRIVRRFSKINK